MATFAYHQTRTTAATKAITHTDLNCLINYIHTFILEDNYNYNCNFVFRYGMPQQFPEGKWGMIVHGDVGIHTRPKVDANDHRASYRYGEMPEYTIEFGSLVRVVAPITDYYEKHAQQVKDPSRIAQAHLAALSRSIPRYQQYLLYKIFAGVKFKQQDTFIKDWFKEYIEPTDGNTNGYAFMLHNAYGEINLKKIITPQEVKVNELKTRLEAISSAIRNNNRKVEVDVNQDDICKTDWIRKNLTPGAIKTLALFNKAIDMADDVVRKGKFEAKFMHKDFAGAAKFKTSTGEDVTWDKWVTPIKSASDLIILFNEKAWYKLQTNYRMSNPVTEFIGSKATNARFILTPLVDEDEVLILHKDLIQIWIYPISVRYQAFDYKQIVEQTRDYFHAFDHSLDLLPVYSNIYLKLKA